MNGKMSKTLILHSPLSPGAAVEVLRSSIDEEHFTLFSWSGFKGSRPIIGEVGVDSFRVRKRINYRNDFVRQFYGRFESEAGGTRIEGHFAVGHFTSIAVAIWFTFAICVGSVIFVGTVTDLLAGRRRMDNNTLVGLLVPPGMVLFGIALVWFGRMLSRRGERFLVDYMRTTLSVRAAE